MARVATRKPASSRSQDHEQRTLDLPGCVRDFSEERKDRGKCPDSILSWWRVCFRHRFSYLQKHMKYRIQYFYLMVMEEMFTY